MILYLDAGSSVDLIDELNEESAVFVTNAIGMRRSFWKGEVKFFWSVEN